MLVRGLYGNREFHIPFWSIIYVALKFTLPVCRGGAEGYSRYSLNTYFFAKKFLYFSDPRKWVFQQENLSPGDAGFDEKTLL